MRRVCAGVVLGLLLVMGPSTPAHAFVAPGTCVVSMTMTFSPALTPVSAPVSNGTTLTSSLCAPVPTITTTITAWGAGGTATLASTCAASVFVGTYSVSFATYFAGSSGTWTFVGGPAGGVFTMVDLVGTALVGVGTLAPTSLNVLSCTTGVTGASFLGTITFLDP